MTITPVVLFVFNRADTLQRVLQALQNQTKDIPLIIVYADAARSPQEEPAVQAVRDIIKAIDWTDVQLIERPENFGGAKNLTTGINAVFDTYEQIVVLEDDTLPASYFYEAMLLLLETYRHEQTIFSVGAYPSISRHALPDYPYDVILSPRFSIWGWGTWKDRWQNVYPKLHNFQQPFTDIDVVPEHAGHDMRFAAQHAEENEKEYFFLGSALALLSLYEGWRHAHTRNYLITNIGHNTGQHKQTFNMHHTTAYLTYHSQLQDNLPNKLPNVSIANSNIDTAVQKHNRELNRRAKQDRFIHDVDYPRRIIRLLRVYISNRLRAFMT